MSLVPTPRRRPFVIAGFFAAVAAATSAFAQTPAPAAPPADFAICSACHESTAGAHASLGPNLFGVGGRKPGSAPDFDYSPAMKAATAPWTAESLAAFIQDPAKTIPGNKMDYDGANAETAKAIADYLMTLKG